MNYQDFLDHSRRMYREMDAQSRRVREGRRSYFKDIYGADPEDVEEYDYENMDGSHHAAKQPEKKSGIGDWFREGLLGLGDMAKNGALDEVMRSLGLSTNWGRGIGYIPDLAVKIWELNKKNPRAGDEWLNRTFGTHFGE